jgi:chaperonin GroEL
MGSQLRGATIELLGQADSIRVERKKTVIVRGPETNEGVASRIDSLKAMIQQSDYEFKREQFEERLAKLASGIAVIKVGAATETEMKEKKLRFEDAVHAAKAAIAEGIVPGGGTALLNIIPAVQAYAATLEGDRRCGASLIARALEAPARQIAVNAGNDGATVVAHIRQAPTGRGFDATTGEYVDLLEQGIIDSAKVTRLALAHAVSASCVLLTTQAGHAKEKRDGAQDAQRT